MQRFLKLIVRLLFIGGAIYLVMAIVAQHNYNASSVLLVIEGQGNPEVDIKFVVPLPANSGAMTASPRAQVVNPPNGVQSDSKHQQPSAESLSNPAPAVSLPATPMAAGTSSYNVEQSQLLRHSNFASACKAHKELRRMTPWRYKYDERHKMLYCPIPKSGWSSWKRVFFYINGAINSMDVEIGITPDKSASIQELSGYAVLRRNVTGAFHPFTFVFVRNPWHRLVSAYINKALDWNYTRILHTPCEWETMTPYKSAITFEQFLTCIVDRDASGKRLDIHWTPMWQLCDMCQINYDIIGHMETIAEDSEYIVRKAGLNLTFPKIFSSQAHKTLDVVHSWYAFLPQALVLRVQKLFKLDFVLNGYSDVPPGWEGKKL